MSLFFVVSYYFSIAVSFLQSGHTKKRLPTESGIDCRPRPHDLRICCFRRHQGGGEAKKEEGEEEKEEDAAEEEGADVNLSK